ncbi:hypothetical protein B0H13DRAFT_1864248 [Mycena leptocephala]|nr:hypothetical protein B0H13DRAFT_1864248 [Mycena leptocephala]
MESGETVVSRLWDVMQRRGRAGEGNSEHGESSARSRTRTARMDAWDGARIDLLVPDVGLHRAGERHWLRRKYEKPQQVCSRARCRNPQEHHQGKSAAMSLRARATFRCFKTDARIDSHGRGEGGWQRARRSRISGVVQTGVLGWASGVSVERRLLFLCCSHSRCFSHNPHYTLSYRIGNATRSGSGALASSTDGWLRLSLTLKRVRPVYPTFDPFNRNCEQLTGICLEEWDAAGPARRSLHSYTKRMSNAGVEPRATWIRQLLVETKTNRAIGPISTVKKYKAHLAKEL